MASKCYLERVTERIGPRAVALHDQAQKHYQVRVGCLGGDAGSTDVLAGIALALNLLRVSRSIADAQGHMMNVLMLLAEGRYDTYVHDAFDEPGGTTRRGRDREGSGPCFGETSGARGAEIAAVPRRRFRWRCDTEEVDLSDRDATIRP
ncbi:MAG: hypothetical protein ACRDLB_04410 [Actinomycetota bacterium]